jgi:hypothetical protein
VVWALAKLTDCACSAGGAASDAVRVAIDSAAPNRPLAVRAPSKLLRGAVEAPAAIDLLLFLRLSFIAFLLIGFVLEGRPEAWKGRREVSIESGKFSFSWGSLFCLNSEANAAPRPTLSCVEAGRVRGYCLPEMVAGGARRSERPMRFSPVFDCCY